MAESLENKNLGNDIDPATGNFTAKENAAAQQVEKSSLDRETLGTFQTLELDIRTDLEPLLDALNGVLNLNMMPRPEGYHLTVISPPESKVLSQLDDNQAKKLEHISSDIQQGIGIEFKGLGLIDGSTASVREADKVKKACFVAVDIPALQAFRESVGLPAKDFHITLGFESGDIHLQVTGTNEKGKPILAPIAKQASPEFNDIWESFKAGDQIEVSGLTGQKK